MSRRSKNRNRQPAPSQPVDHLGRYSYGMVDWSTWMPRSIGGEVVTAESAMRHSTVLACVLVLSQTMSVLQPWIYRRRGNGKGRDLVHDHRLAKLWRRGPNSWQTTPEWLETMTSHCVLRGNAYSRIVPGDLGSVSKLIPLHPDHVQVYLSDDDELFYQYTNPKNGKTITLMQNEVHHWRWLSDNGLVGMTPFEKAKESIGLGLAQSKFQAKTLENGAAVKLVLESDQPLRPEVVKELRENFDRVHGGADNAGKTPVLGFGLKAHEVGMKNSDLQFLEQTKATALDICRLFRVPPHMVGLLDRATSNNIEQQTIDFRNGTMAPWAKKIAARMTADLLDSDDNEEINYDLDELMAGDTEARARMTKDYVLSGQRTLNDVLEEAGENGIGPAGDVRFMPSTMTTIDRIIAGQNAAVGQTGPSPGSPQAGEVRNQPIPRRREKSGPKPAAFSMADLAGTVEDIVRLKLVPEIQAAAAAQVAAATQKSVLSAEKLGAIRENADSMLGQQFRKMQRWECDAIENAAKRPEKFLAKIQEFYAEHQRRLADAIASPLAILSVANSREYDAVHIAAIYVTESEKTLVELSGTATNDTLQSIVREAVDTWTITRQLSL